jgi:hypothetical protein
MKTYITLDPNNYLRLTLIVPAVALLGLASCSTVDHQYGTIRQRT